MSNVELVQIFFAYNGEGASLLSGVAAVAFTSTNQQDRMSLFLFKCGEMMTGADRLNPLITVLSAPLYTVV